MGIDLYNLVISAKLQKGGGGGGDITVEELNVTENGTYSASSGYAFDPVTVSVPQSGITPTGTSNITSNGIYDVTNYASASVSVPGIVPSGTSEITANGIYDITNYASASVSVPIPSGYIQPTGTSSITANGIYDITNFASVDVNVSGGGGGGFTADDIAMRKISGAISGSATQIDPYAFRNCNALTAASFSNATSIGSLAFQYCNALTAASFPNVKKIGSSAFQYCSALTTAIFLASSIATLSNSNAFAVTPMSNSTYTGSFGSIYVPASLVDSYKAANNWSVYADRITSYVE